MISGSSLTKSRGKISPLSISRSLLEEKTPVQPGKKSSQTLQKIAFAFWNPVYPRFVWYRPSDELDKMLIGYGLTRPFLLE
jgi:hypothetical protein